MFSIMNRWTNCHIASGKDARGAIEAAVIDGTDLTDAYLSGADLAGADLSGANLAGADLSGAILSGADLAETCLRGANLTRADLPGADLAGADLTRARLSGALLSGAYLNDANLSGAYLTDANLDGAILTRANLAGTCLCGANVTRADLSWTILTGVDFARADIAKIKEDLFEVLNLAANEVPALVSAITEGRIDGSAYDGRGCLPLVRAIAKARGCALNALAGINPDGYRPAERWFLALRPGCTPDTSPVASLTLKWIEEWSRLRACQAKTNPT